MMLRIGISFLVLFGLLTLARAQVPTRLPSAAPSAPLPAGEVYPCWLILWGQSFLTKVEIDAYVKKASPMQRMAGRICLGLSPMEPVRRKFAKHLRKYRVGRR